MAMREKLLRAGFRKVSRNGYINGHVAVDKIVGGWGVWLDGRYRGGFDTLAGLADILAQLLSGEGIGVTGG